MTDEIALRASALGYGPCRGRWWAIHRRREVEQAGYQLAPRRSHIAGPLGSGVHAGAAYLLGQLAETGTLGDQRRLAAAQDKAITTFEERCTEAEQNGSELIVDQTTPNKDHGKLSIAKMVELGATTIQPDDRPVLIEQTLRTILANGVILTATPDKFLIQQPAGGRLPDLKTGRYHPVSAAEQLGAQSLLVRAKYGTAAVAWLGIESQPRAPAKKVRPPKSVQMIQGICERMAIDATNQIKRDTEAWRADPVSETIQKMPTDFLCSARYCPAYGVRGPNAWCHAWLLREAATRNGP